MKKIFLFMLAVTSTVTLSSCSKDSSSSSTNKISMKVAGVDRQFNTIQVVEEAYNEEGIDYVDLFITATESGSTSNYITFYVAKGATGPYVSWAFTYTLNGVLYEEDAEGSIDLNATTNASKKLKGTFDGTLSSGTGSSIALSQGAFDISY